MDEGIPEAAAELAGDLSVAFLHMLERLAPDERAAFVLRQVFDYGYPEAAERQSGSVVARLVALRRGRSKAASR